LVLLFSEALERVDFSDIDGHVERGRTRHLLNPRTLASDVSPATFDSPDRSTTLREVGGTGPRMPPCTARPTTLTDASGN